MIPHRRWCQAVALTVLGVSAACQLARAATETSKVMGNIDVAAGEHTGDLSTVNGSIRIGENAVVGTAHTVNGSISLAPHATAAELKTVNGSIMLERQSSASAEVHSVNGGLTVADGAAVGGALRNVNGAIRVAAAHVAGGIDTVTAGIELGPNAHIDGGIHVHKDNSWSGGLGKVPRIVIGPGSVVGGTLNFERPVKLYVSDKAVIGTVQGATVEKYSGEKPPPD
jgi:DUF4097 and DUF4098 domain-containing protein YvlB